MKALRVAHKTLRELWREPLLLGLLLFFPAAFVAIYYVAFGQTDQGFATYLSVLVVNDDAGVALAGGGSWQAGAELVEVLAAAEWEGAAVFDIEVVTDDRVAAIALGEQKAALLLTIPPDFSRVLLDHAAGGEGTSPVTVALRGDPGSDRYVFARSFLAGLLRAFAGQAVGREEALVLDYEFVPGTGTMSDFDFGVAGLIVFGIMFVMISTATVLVREKVGGTLQRLRLTPAGAADLLLGVTLAQMVTAAVQIPITFGAALAFGFRCHGSLGWALAIGLLLNLSAVGLGLVVASVARNDGDAVNLGSALLVPFVFLSGAIFPLPPAPLFTIAGQTVEAYDLLPATHASEALRQVLIQGAGLEAIIYELVAMTLLSGLTLVVGMGLYHRLRMKGA